MAENVTDILRNLLEPVGPTHQELHPIAPGKSWAILRYNVPPPDTKPVLFSHLKRLSPDFSVRMISFPCSEVKGETIQTLTLVPVTEDGQKVEVINALRAVINDSTFAWVEEGDSMEDSGKIQIVGDTGIVKTLASQICEDPQRYEMPSGKEIFPPLANWVRWVEAKFGIGHFDVNVLRNILASLRTVKVNTYIPIEDWDCAASMGMLPRLFAVINGNTFLQADLSGYQLFGPKLNLDLIARELGQGQQFTGEVFDWINLDAEGKPTRLDLVGRV